MASRINIAIVEDHDELRFEMAKFLERSGYPVKLFSDAESVKESRDQFDLYIIDIGLPAEDGISLAQFLKRASPKSHIFILTAFDENKKRITSFQLGIDLFLTKPIDPEELISAIAMAEGKLVSNKAPELILELSRDQLFGSEGKVKLSASEAALLKTLIGKRQMPLPISEIAHVLSLPNDSDNTRAIEARISILRKKINEAGGARNCISVIRGKGYRLNENIVMRKLPEEGR